MFSNQLSEAGISAKAMLAEQLGYGTGDKGIAAMTEDLEDGLIGSEIAVQALLEGMKQFEGTMEKTANETVEGLKSQLEDTFEINILRRWGQGLQDGAKRGLGSILELLDKSEGSLEKIGDTVYEIGKELSNWAADKLEDTIDKIIEITNRDDFKEASLGGKIKILWDEVIADPFSKWWDSKGKPYIVEKMNSLGEAIGSGLSKSLMALLGVDISDATDDALSIGGSFAEGFARGFEGKKVWDALVDAAGRAFKSGFELLFSGSWLTNIIATKLALQATTGVLKGINAVQTIWNGTGATTATGGLTLAGMGMKNAIGSTGNVMVNGSGMLGGLASLGYAATGGAATSTMSGGMAALAGLGTAAGIVGTVAGLGNSAVDLGHYAMADTKNDEKLYGTRAATKAGMVATGALIGTAIAPGIGTAIGAGLGGLATFLAGNKVADAISGVTKTTKELNEEAEELARKRMDERFKRIATAADGTQQKIEGITLTSEELNKRVEEIFGVQHLNRVNKFNQSMEDLKTIQDSLLNYKGDISYTTARIKAGEELSESDVTEYQNDLQGYSDSVSQLLQGNKTASISAFELLFGDDKDGLQKATERINDTYTKLEKELANKTKELNTVISDAFADGKIDIKEQEKINELIEQIDKIYEEVDKHIKAKEEAERNASYDLLQTKYSDSDLSAESFKELMSELDKQSKVDQKAYDDAYIKAKAEIDLEFEDHSSEEYKKALEEIENKWRDGKALSVEKSVKVSLNVLTEHYAAEIRNFKYKLRKDLESGLSDGNIIDIRNATSSGVGNRGLGTFRTIHKWDDDSVKDFEEMKNTWLKELGVDGALQKELSEMYESLKPQEEDLLALKKSYEDAGKEIPKWIEDSLADIENIKLMSGDMDSFYKVIGEQFAKEDKAYAEKLLSEAGEDLPEALKEGLEKGIAAIEATEFKTNLKLTADKKGIDTSNLDKSMQDVVKKLENKDVIFTQDGEVKIKTKDGKIDTSNLDEETKKAVEKLEKDGYITVEKDGKVTFNTPEVETQKFDEATEKALESLQKDGYFEVSKDGKVTITAKGGIDIDDVDEKTEKAIRALEESGIIEIDKEGKVTITANVESKTVGEEKAAEDAKNKSVVALDNEFSVPIPQVGQVTVDSNTTGQENAAVKSYNAFKNPIDLYFSNPISETGKVHTDSQTTGQQTAAEKSFGLFTTAVNDQFVTQIDEKGNVYINGISLSGVATAVSNAWQKLKDKVASVFSNPISATGRVKYQIGQSNDDGNDPKKANGGYVDKAVRTIVGEAGPEYIIPVGANRKQRGKYLWERAGRALGLYGTTTHEKVYFNANGGLYGTGAAKADSLANSTVNYGDIANYSTMTENAVNKAYDTKEKILTSERTTNTSISGEDSLLNKIANYATTTLFGYSNNTDIDGDEETTVNHFSKLGDMLNEARSNSVSETTNTQNNNSSTQKSSVNVNVGGITFTIQGGGKGIETDLAENEDAIVGRIAKMLEQAFENMPLAVTD